MSDDLRIRLATIDDAAELARLLSPLGHAVSPADVVERWRAWDAEGNQALVATERTGIVGVVTLHRMRVLHRAQPVGRITSLAVDEAHRGRGLGRALVDAAEATLRAAGCGWMEVTSHVRRREAHTFYEHLGFERTSHRFARELD